MKVFGTSKLVSEGHRKDEVIYFKLVKKFDLEKSK